MLLACCIGLCAVTVPSRAVAQHPPASRAAPAPTPGTNWIPVSWTAPAGSTGTTAYNAVSYDVQVPDLSAQGAAGANSPASGRPTINGKAQAGHILTADTSNIADADGLENATLTYQWLAIRGATEVVIQGVTERAYTVTGDDIGARIALTVSFSDDQGNRERLTSSPTSEIESAWPYEVLHPPFNLAKVWWWWRYNGDCTGAFLEFETVTVDFTIHNDPNYSTGGGMFLMLLNGNISGKSFYFGLQTRLQPPLGRPAAKGALFSRWDTRDQGNAAADPDHGWTYEGGYEGDFVSARRSYEWSAGDYRARLARDSSRESNADGVWYGLWFTDLDTNVETWIGSLRFPLVEGETHIEGLFSTVLEIYGGAVRPADVPAWHVSVGIPAVDGVDAGCAQTRYPDVEAEDVTSEIRYDTDQRRMHLEAFGATRRQTSQQLIFFPDRAGRVTLSSALPRVGEILRAGLHDSDGSADARWQWSRGVTPTGAFSAINGATESSYTPASGDVRMYLQAAVTYDDGHGSGKRAEAASSDPVRAVVVNRPPAFPLPSVSFQLDHAAGPGIVVGTVGATDPDGDGLTYSLSGPDAAFFVIDAGTGQIRTAAGVSFDAEVRSQYRVRVHVDDGQGGADTVDVVITVTARPIILPPIGLGGGGGGGPSGPTPSEVDFEWNVKRDIEELDGGNDRATGVWSDGTTLWVADNADGAGDTVYAYDLASGERVEEREFELDERNRAPRGVWSDRTTIWVSDSGQNRLFAHNLESGEPLPERDIALAERNRDARGIWSDGETMWVLDGRADALFPYALASGELLAEYALDSANDDPHGIWSDGVTVWVSDHGAKRLFAYRLPVLPDAETDPGEEDADDDAGELERVRDEEFSKLSRAGNNSPRGIWSDGDVMYVADESDDRVYSYNMPDAIDARLASLTLSGVDIGEFDPGRPDYEAVVADGVTETTVEAEAMQPRTTIVTDPEDADTEVDGHQVALQDLGEITVTVTSADGSRTRVYRVQFPDTGWDPARDPWPHCLRGAVSEGFSLVVYEGGSVEELMTCAESRDIVALYALHEGVYVSHILGAPDFVNAGFLELFPDGLPPITPLVAASDGPPSADPFGDLDDGGRQPWPECLRGTVAAGFSLVVYEGGSVDELEGCARSADITALYALSEGEFVSYILGAPEFVTQPFHDLFADGLPPMTPLVARSEEHGDR